MWGDDRWYSQAGRAWGEKLSFYVDTWTEGVVGESPPRRRAAEIERPAVRPLRGEWGSYQVTEPWYWEDGMSRLFTLSHRECFDLMRAWGFEPERISGGHQIMRDPATGTRVQIMPPGRSGTGEKGNAIGMKKAAAIRGVPLQAFLDGPTSTKEEKMAAGRPMSEVGLAADMRRWIEAHAGSSFTPHEMHADLLSAHPDLKIGVIQSMLAQGAQPKRVNQPILREGKVYRFATKEEKAAELDRVARLEREKVVEAARHAAEKQEAAVSSPPESFVTDETPAENEYKAPPMPEPIDEKREAYAASVLGAPRVVPSNGTTPDLLSKVATLDGGKFLFQGDDGALYVLRDVVRLEV